jgi:hypothetical protein
MNHPDPLPAASLEQPHDLRRLLLSLGVGAAAIVFVVALLAANSIPTRALTQADISLTQIASDALCSVLTPDAKGYISAMPVTDEQFEAARGHLLLGQPTAGPTRTPTPIPPVRTLRAPIGTGNAYYTSDGH